MRLTQGEALDRGCEQVQCTVQCRALDFARLDSSSALLAASCSPEVLFDDPNEGVDGLGRGSWVRDRRTPELREDLSSAFGYLQELVVECFPTVLRSPSRRMWEAGMWEAGAAGVAPAGYASVQKVRSSLPHAQLRTVFVHRVAGVDLCKPI